MLKSSMRRFLLPILLWLFALPSAQSQSSAVAHGLIIQLKPGAQSELSRELPSAAHAKRESLAHERMAAISQGAGVYGFAHRHLSSDHRLMRFANPLQGADLQATIRRLRLHPDVAFVEPNVRLKPLNVPNDASFAQQWHLGSSNLPANASALGMTRTWALTTGTAITVAVIDTGVRYSHPDLAGRLLPGYDFIEDVANANDGDGRDGDASDPGDWLTTSERRLAEFAGCDVADSSWHGTFIAGQIAAASNNLIGVAGMNWNARILPVRVSGKCGALLSDILDGMRWAAGLPVSGVRNNPHPAKLVSLSFGGDQPCSASYQSVIDEMAKVGSLLVVAAGNSQGFNDNMLLKRPADCKGVLAVGAAQDNGVKASYSYVGSMMSLMAPGGNGILAAQATQILSTDNDGLREPTADTYGYKSGTSFAAPLAAGAASMMLAINPNITPDALISRLKASSRPHVAIDRYPSCFVNNQVACNCTTSLCGSGLLDPFSAVQAAYSPAAVIRAGQPVSPGTKLTLDGSLSAAVTGAFVSAYQWAQVGGSPLTIPNAGHSVTQVVLPASADSFVFQLTVVDNLGRSGVAEMAFVSASAGAGGASSGGGATHRGALAILILLASLVLIARNKSARNTPKC